jgi:alpha/beta hydrolase fold
MTSIGTGAQAVSGSGNIQRDIVSVAGVSSPVLSCGPHDKSDAVVFVHGNLGAAHEWPDLMRQTCGFARCLAVDMPGFAGADKPSDFHYTAHGYARHLDGVLESARGRPCTPGRSRLRPAMGASVGRGPSGAFASATMINCGIWVDYPRYHRYGRIWGDGGARRTVHGHVDTRGDHVHADPREASPHEGPSQPALRAGTSLGHEALYPAPVPSEPAAIPRITLGAVARN